MFQSFLPFIVLVLHPHFLNLFTQLQYDSVKNLFNLDSVNLLDYFCHVSRLNRRLKSGSEISSILTSMAFLP